MRRQIVIGSLVGIALGGLVTFSLANGVFGASSSAAQAENPAPAPQTKRDSVREAFSSYDGQPPLRPGSDRFVEERPQVARPAASAPVALETKTAELGNV